MDLRSAGALGGRSLKMTALTQQPARRNAKLLRSSRTTSASWKSTPSATPKVVNEPTSVLKTEAPIVTTQAATKPALSQEQMQTAAMAVGGLVVAAAAAKWVLDTPSRTYTGKETVGKEYDAWTDDGVLEHYWGEHIHLGYYSHKERAAGYKKKDFVEAKKDFVYEMLKWSGCPEKPTRILDCGCGIGGTSRLLAKRFPDAQITGITLSSSQVRRGTELAKEQGLENVEFKVMNALHQEFDDDTFDLVWACESGEHMPDKTAYVNEMVRVLKPGGALAVATWCQREETPEAPLSQKDRSNLQFLYDEWAHPHFVSYQEYMRIMHRTGVMTDIQGEDWVKETIDSWRHSIWVGVWSPWFVVFKGPWVWYKTVREIVTLERMHRAFDRGLMTYGMIKGKKKAKPAQIATAAQPATVQKVKAAEPAQAPPAEKVKAAEPAQAPPAEKVKAAEPAQAPPAEKVKAAEPAQAPPVEKVKAATAAPVKAQVQESTKKQKELHAALEVLASPSGAVEPVSADAAEPATQGSTTKQTDIQAALKLLNDAPASNLEGGATMKTQTSPTSPAKRADIQAALELLDSAPSAPTARDIADLHADTHDNVSDRSK